MSKITAVHARQIFDSRGNPTVECDITTTDGMFRAAVPSGASTGVYEGASAVGRLRQLCALSSSFGVHARSAGAPRWHQSRLPRQGREDRGREHQDDHR
eukprot:4812023-Prymnesium_polylepis.1